MKRIQLTDIYGRKIEFHIQSTTIVEVREASPSQSWHGVRSNVRVSGGDWYEVRETPDQIANKVNVLL